MTKPDPRHGKEPDLAGSLIATIANDEALKAAGEIAQAALEAAIDSDLLDAVPVVGTLSALYRTYSGIRERLFRKKVCGFLFSLSNVPDDRRKQFADSLDKDSAQRQRVGEGLFLLLDRLDDLDKPPLYGRAFAAYLRREIQRDELERIGAILDRSRIDDLRTAHSLRAEKVLSLDPHIALALQSVGVIEPLPMGLHPMDSTDTRYRMTPFGRRALEIVLREEELPREADVTRYRGG